MTDARELLGIQFRRGHDLLEATIADCPPALLSHQFAGGTITPIAVIYAHALLSEDALVTRAVGDGQTVFAREGWSERLGFAEAAAFQAADWRDRAIDMPAFRDYAASVYRATGDLLAAATDETLSRNVGRNQPMTAIEFLAQIGVLHVAEHWGEIAALKGVLGARGLAF
ncbi:MAG: DinB family protein [Dehalococcoidia bacterium]